MATIEQVIAGYIKLREQKDALRKQHAAEMQPITNKMDILEAFLLKTLQEQNADSVKTKAGTTYQSTITKHKVVDRSALLDYVIKNQLWDMLNVGVAKDVMDEYEEEHGCLPPGVTATKATFARVRK